MHVRSLELHHFRNIETLRWAPAPGLNLIWGGNGQGKTNLLEALHCVLTGRSFRTRRDEDCLPWGRRDDPADPTRVDAALQRRAGRRDLRLLIGRRWKRAFVDATWLPRLGDLWREAAVVTFTPEDAALLKGPPADRCRFLDIVLSQTSAAYLGQLQRYQRALKQVNAVLRTSPPTRDVRGLAEAYWPELAEAGAHLMCARAAALAEAAEPFAARYRELGGAEPVELVYDANLGRYEINPDGTARPFLDTRRPRSADEPLAAGSGAWRPLTGIYLERLRESYDEGRRHGLCAAGVHRDDFSVRLAGQDLRRFGSQGQHRLVALTLKLESARWIERTLGEPPILMLDDFGSELDPGRRMAVLAGLRGSMQVLITATHPRDLGGQVEAGFAAEIRHGTLA